ncbi:LysE family translocator [Methylophaga sp.]|uniref:LysE family translocator n=1 Tax=Methylophaga sp. TaxID=2024840 RepID=UPI003F6A2F6D
MSIIEIMTLFGIMASLAALPSTSVALVITRSVTLGIGDGVAAAVGICLADLFFILLVMFGLSLVAETMGNFFLVIKYMGASYLVWLGFSFLVTKPQISVMVNATNGKSSLISSFLGGLVLTLGDVKAIFFYLSLFPLFIDLASLQITDVFLVMWITIISVGGVKIIYVLMARKILVLVQGHSFETVAKKTIGVFWVAVGGYILTKGLITFFS